jgi:hypothetical protein
MFWFHNNIAIRPVNAFGLAAENQNRCIFNRILICNNNKAKLHRGVKHHIL